MDNYIGAEYIERVKTYKNCRARNSGRQTMLPSLETKVFDV